MDVAELVLSIRKAQKNVRHSNFRRNKETKNDFIKRINRYQCAYCLSKQDSKKLSATVEPFHSVRTGETLDDIASRYQTTIKKLNEINPELKGCKLQKGDLLRLPDYFNIFPNKHGICFCKKCGSDRREKGMDHVSYVSYIVRERRKVRNGLTYNKKQKVLERDEFECQYCKIEFDNGKKFSARHITVDHKKPIASGGTNDIENLISSCFYHNIDKNRDNYETYIKKIKDRKFRERNTLDIARAKVSFFTEKN